MLQKPLKPGRRFSRLKLTQAKVATKSDSGPITEVTDELSARSCDPHILTRKTRLRPRNFLINDAKGLLQQYRPFSAAPIVRLRVRYRRSCCRTGRVVGEAVDDPKRRNSSL